MFSGTNPTVLSAGLVYTSCIGGTLLVLVSVFFAPFALISGGAFEHARFFCCSTPFFEHLPADADLAFETDVRHLAASQDAVHGGLREPEFPLDVLRS